MKKVLRYFFYVILATILVAICTSIILYASGYRLNPKARKLVKTGMLIINYEENGIGVFLDGENIKAEEHQKLGLLSAYYSFVVYPGKYNLEIQKDGMLTYQKNIKIEPELITKIEDLVLLPKEINPQTVLTSEMTGYSISPDTKKIIYQDKEFKLRLYNIEDNKDSIFDINFPNSKVESYTWNGSKILLKTTTSNHNAFFYLNTNSPEKSYFLHEKLSFSPFFEDLYVASENSDIFFGLSGNTIYKINGDTRKTDKLEEKVSYLANKNGSLYFQQINKNQKNDLVQFNPILERKDTVLENFDINSDFEILSANGKLYMKNNFGLFLIKDSNTLELVEKDEVRNIIPSLNGSDFFYIKNNELFIYDCGKQEKVFITRFSQDIKNIKEFYGNRFFLYLLNQKMGMISKKELTDQVIIEDTNIIEIATLEKNKILVVENQDSLYTFKIVDLLLK